MIRERACGPAAAGAHSGHVPPDPSGAILPSIRWKFIAQAVVTVALLAWLLGRLDRQVLLHAFLAVKPLWFALAVLMYFLSLAVSALRGRFIMDSIERPMSFFMLLRLNWIGAFFNQVLPGAVSGDAVRAYCSRTYTRSLTLAAAAVFGERLIGLGVLIALAAGVFLLTGAALPTLPQVPFLLGLFSLAYILGLAILLSPRLDERFDRIGALGVKIREARIALRALFRHGSDLLWALVLSLLVQVLSILLFWSVAMALDLRLDAMAVWVVWPLVTLLTILPVSLAGWGLREGLLVYYLTHLGVSADKALALSVLTGLAVLLASLPGGMAWLLMQDRPKRIPVDGSA